MWYTSLNIESASTDRVYIIVELNVRQHVTMTMEPYWGWHICQEWDGGISCCHMQWKCRQLRQGREGGKSSRDRSSWASDLSRSLTLRDLYPRWHDCHEGKRVNATGNRRMLWRCRLRRTCSWYHYRVCQPGMGDLREGRGLKNSTCMCQQRRRLRRSMATRMHSKVSRLLGLSFWATNINRWIFEVHAGISETRVFDGPWPIGTEIWIWGADCETESWKGSLADRGQSVLDKTRMHT
jgi:hypothetical protein